jgi:hypothetical protein
MSGKTCIREMYGKIAIGKCPEKLQLKIQGGAK